MTYSDKLKNPLWQKKRLDIYQRDNFTCRFCFASHKTLHLHHWGYEKGKEPWEYEDDNYLTLCEECHKNIIPKIRILEKIILKNIWLKLKFEVHIKEMADFMERFDEDTLYKFFSVMSEPILTDEEIISNMYELNDYMVQKDLNFRKILSQCQESEQ